MTGASRELLEKASEVRHLAERHVLEGNPQQGIKMYEHSLLLLEECLQQQSNSFNGASENKDEDGISNEMQAIEDCIADLRKAEFVDDNEEEENGEEDKEEEEGGGGGGGEEEGEDSDDEMDGNFTASIDKQIVEAKRRAELFKKSLDEARLSEESKLESRQWMHDANPAVHSILPSGEDESLASSSSNTSNVPVCPPSAPRMSGNTDEERILSLQKLVKSQQREILVLSTELRVHKARNAALEQKIGELNLKFKPPPNSPRSPNNSNGSSPRTRTSSKSTESDTTDYTAKVREQREETEEAKAQLSKSLDGTSPRRKAKPKVTPKSSNETITSWVLESDERMLSLPPPPPTISQVSKSTSKERETQSKEAAPTELRETSAVSRSASIDTIIKKQGSSSNAPKRSSTPTSGLKRSTVLKAPVKSSYEPQHLARSVSSITQGGKRSMGATSATKNINTNINTNNTNNNTIKNKNIHANIIGKAAKERAKTLAENERLSVSVSASTSLVKESMTKSKTSKTSSPTSTVRRASKQREVYRRAKSMKAALGIPDAMRKSVRVVVPSGSTNSLTQNSGKILRKRNVGGPTTSGSTVLHESRSKVAASAQRSAYAKATTRPSASKMAKGGVMTTPSSQTLRGSVSDSSGMDSDMLDLSQDSASSLKEATAFTKALRSLRRNGA